MNRPTVRSALLLSAGVAVLAAGCATPIGVKRIRPEEANRQLTANVLTTGKPGAPAQELLYRLGLSEKYLEDPAGTIAELHAGLGQADDYDRLFALAELSFDYGEHGGGRSSYLASAAYAWAFLFPEDPAARPGCYDPRARTAMDLYNRGLAAGLASGTGDEVDLSVRSVALPYGPLQLDMEPSGFTFGGYQLVDFKSLADYQVRGLRNRYRQRGIGAPLAASVSKGEDRVDPWIGPYVKVPVTVDQRADERPGSRATLPVLVLPLNTGNPVAYSAMGLREALQHVVAGIDPHGTDPALRQMVVIGHSQGGLLTKMTVVNSGTHFWDASFKVPFDQADLPPETRDLLRRSIFVAPLPFVTEVVFICTPHRGSYLADNFLGNIARKLVSLPGNVAHIGVALVKLQPKDAATAITMPTSIDNMKGSNRFVRTLVTLPIAPGVHAHSIIAVQGDGPPEQGDDGVVKYTSAHIDGVDSELIVRDSHSTQATPKTIEEVRRILYAT